MSEFYANRSFLDREHLFAEYNSIISCLSLSISEAESVKNKLRKYSGYGIETQIENLNKCCEQLKSYREDVRAEYASLAKIIDAVNEHEKMAVGIIGGISNKFSLSGYAAGSDERIILSGLADAQDKTTKTFDDDKKNGTYGADQGDMANNKKGMWFFGFRWFEDEDLYAYIRQHSRYKNYSQTQIANLMDQINSEGCGYVAIVNNIFVEYEGREEEFENKFGFPMYDKNGKANYDYLIVDFYANTDDKYYIDEEMGAAALVNDVILQYIGGREDEFRKKYGCDPLMEDGKKINDEARQKILDEYQDTSVVTMYSSGTTSYSLENRFRHYMEQKGITYTAEAVGGDAVPGASEINSYLDEGKNVNIAVGGFNLYDQNGKIAAKNVSNHWMTITGITDDGRYIVSSWGKRYYLKPGELSGTRFFITDITP